MSCSFRVQSLRGDLPETCAIRNPKNLDPAICVIQPITVTSLRYVGTAVSEVILLEALTASGRWRY